MACRRVFAVSMLTLAVIIGLLHIPSDDFSAVRKIRDTEKDIHVKPITSADTRHSQKDSHNDYKDLYSSGSDVEECIEDYNTPGQALRYEQAAEAMSYQGPSYCADLLAGLLVNKRSKASVLDAAAGSGQVGVELSQRGFKNITAQDGSFSMLKECRSKGVYTYYICCMIEDDQRLPIDNGSYDAVTVSGAIMEHHLPPSCQAEFSRIVKRGGYIVTAYNSVILNTEYGRSWEKETRRLVEKGICSLYAKVIVPNYVKDAEGVINILQVL